MNITVKQLQGGECSLEVFPTTEILHIKQQLSTKFGVPVERQKLLFSGRALNDYRTIETYPSIKNGTKLNLVVKKVEGIAEVATKHFKKNGISETEAKAKAALFIQVLEENFNKLSWDDVERLSIDCMVDENGTIQPDEEKENVAEGM